jgi:hypothetical protein
MSKNMVDRSQTQSILQASNSQLETTNIAHSIHTIENYEQQRNDLSDILICIGHVLRRSSLSNCLFSIDFSMFEDNEDKLATKQDICSQLLRIL